MANARGGFGGVVEERIAGKISPLAARDTGTIRLYDALFGRYSPRE